MTTHTINDTDACTSDGWHAGWIEKRAGSDRYEVRCYLDCIDDEPSFHITFWPDYDIDNLGSPVALEDDRIGENHGSSFYATLSEAIARCERKMVNRASEREQTRASCGPVGVDGDGRSVEHG